MERETGTGVFMAEEVDGAGDNGQNVPQQLMWRHNWRPF
jgi:hypothetical protein